MACLQMTKVLVLSCSIVSLVVATTASHRPTGLLPSCTDDESYRSSLGLSCFQHRHLDCDSLSELGLIKRQELEGLLASCPVSCNTPLCSNEHKAAGKRAKHNDTGYKVTELLPADRAVQRRDQSSCYPNWPSTCQDDASYTNKIGLGCPQMIVFSCDEMHKIGFSEQETYDLINACPCSCGIMCGTWTGPPTEKPIPAPSSPSTFSPTTVPTAGPSPMVMDPSAFTPTTTPTTNVFLPSNSPTSQPSSSVGQIEKSPSTTTAFVPQGLEQPPETNIDDWDSTGISDTLTISLFFVAGAVMSLLAVAAYYSFMKKRKLAPEVVHGEEAGSPTLNLSPDAEEGGGQSKKSEQASSIWETDRFVVICDEEYDSKNNGGDEGLEIADTSLPRPMSPAKLDKMLQEGSTQSNDITVQEASLGASTIYTNDQASLRFEDDYIGEVESYSKATCTTVGTRETEDDEVSGKTPQISNRHTLASFWRKKRLAQVAKAKDAATEESKTKPHPQDLHNEKKESLMESEEEEGSVITKVISHRTNETKSISEEKSDSSTVIIAESSCNALGNCMVASPGGTKTSHELLDVGGIEAEVKQAKDDLKNEMNQLRKDLGLNIVKNKEFSGMDASVLDEQSTFTDSLWTRDTKESTITRGSYGRFDQELNDAKDFLVRGASDFIDFLASPTQGCAKDSTQDGNKMERYGDEGPGKDDVSHREGFAAYSFSTLEAKRSTRAPTAKTAANTNNTTGDTSEDIEVEVTNKPMALHTFTKTRTGHAARIVKGIHGAVPHGISRQAQTKHKNAAPSDTIDGDVDDDKSDAYTCTPMTRDTTCAKESQDKTTTKDVDPVHSVWNRWKISKTPKESFDESSWDATTYADDTVMHETRKGRGSEEFTSALYTDRSIQESGTSSRSVGTASRASLPTERPEIKTVVRKNATRSVTSPTNAGTVSTGVALKQQKVVYKGLEKKQKAGADTGKLKRSKK